MASAAKQGRRGAAAGNEARWMGSAADDGGRRRPAGANAPLDLAYLRRFTHGNVALEREVLQLFAMQLPVSLAELRSAATPKAWREWSHTIKGSAAAVGAKRVAAVALAAEQLDFADGEARAAAVTALGAAADEVCRLIASIGGGSAASELLVFKGNAG
jgi:HPt (histidine-containing phosphotransfer) domain-containing protein